MVEEDKELRPVVLQNQLCRSRRTRMTTGREDGVQVNRFRQVGSKGNISPNTVPGRTISLYY